MDINWFMGGFFDLNLCEWVIAPEIRGFYQLIYCGVISKIITFFNAEKVFTLPLSVLITAGFSLSSSNSPLLDHIGNIFYLCL